MQLLAEPLHDLGDLPVAEEPAEQKVKFRVEFRGRGVVEVPGRTRLAVQVLPQPRGLFGRQVSREPPDDERLQRDPDVEEIDDLLEGGFANDDALLG